MLNAVPLTAQVSHSTDIKNPQWLKQIKYITLNAGPTAKMFFILLNSITHHYLWFDVQHDYVCTKWILDHSGPPPPPPPPPPQGLHCLWKFRDSSLNCLGATVWHYRWAYGWMDGWMGGYHNVPAFFSKSRGKIISICPVVSKKKDFKKYSTQVTFHQGH